MYVRSFGASGVRPWTISRELRRNASIRSNELAYRATTAQWHAANDRLRDYMSASPA